MTTITYRVGRPPAPPPAWRRAARWLLWRWAAPTAVYVGVFAGWITYVRSGR